MFNYLGGNFTATDVISADIFEVYALWHMQCSISVPMYQPYSPCGDHDALLFGLLLITILVPYADNGVRL